jgi:hypothetical protein
MISFDLKPLIIILLMLIVIFLFWLVWPRELLQIDTADLIKEDVNKEIITKNIDDNLAIDNVCYYKDVKTPRSSILADIPPSPFVQFSTNDLKYQLNQRIAQDVKNIIENPNPIGPNFVSRGQQICKLTMEALYHVPFTTARPSYLINPETGHNLELDCYNEQLKLAVEYNGRQHYIYDEDKKDKFHKSKEDFLALVRRDHYKQRLCQKHKIYLIVVPYNVNNKDIPNFIVTFLPEVIRKNSETKYIINQIISQIKD